MAKRRTTPSIENRLNALAVTLLDVYGQAEATLRCARDIHRHVVKCAAAKKCLLVVNARQSLKNALSSLGIAQGGQRHAAADPRPLQRCRLPGVISLDRRLSEALSGTQIGSGLGRATTPFLSGNDECRMAARCV